MGGGGRNFYFFRRGLEKKGEKRRKKDTTPVGLKRAFEKTFLIRERTDVSLEIITFKSSTNSQRSIANHRKNNQRI